MIDITPTIWHSRAVKDATDPIPRLWIPPAVICIIPLLALAASAQPANWPGGKVYAWGYDSYGQTNVPASATNVIAIAVDRFQYRHALALRSDGTVVAWGDTNNSLSMSPPEATNVVAIAAAGEDNVALRGDGSVIVWGRAIVNITNVPPDATDINAIAAGNRFVLALRSDGHVVAWGTSTITNIPPEATNIIAIAAGSTSCFALRNDGVLLYWSPTTCFDILIPPDVVAVAADQQLNNAVLLRSDKTAVGPSTYFHCSGPAGTFSNVSAIVAGFSRCLVARSSTEALLDWSEYSTTTIPNATNVTAMAVGSGYGLALRADRTVIGWGDNTYGQIDIPPWLQTETAAVACGQFLSMAIATETFPDFYPPKVTRNPRSQTTQVGSAVNLAVQATGISLQYQWLFNDTNSIPGATNAFLALTDIRLSQSGSYKAVVSNQAGSATSEPAVVTVVPALDLHTVPAITLFGDAGSSIRVDYVNALGPGTNWTALATVMLTNTSQLYFDTSAIGQPARYYRLVLTP